MPVVQLALPGPHDVVGVGEAERDEQQAGLVDVVVVLVDDGDLDVVAVVLAEAGWPSACRRCRRRGSRFVVSFGVPPWYALHGRPRERLSTGPIVIPPGVIGTNGARHPRAVRPGRGKARPWGRAFLRSCGPGGPVEVRRIELPTSTLRT